MDFPRDERERQSAPVLSAEQIASLRPLGEIRQTHAGDVLFEVGDSTYPMVVVLAGRTEIIDRSEGIDRVIKTSGPGEFQAELGLLTGQAVFVACVVREAGEVLLIPAAAVQEIIATMPGLSDVLVTAFAARRRLLMHSAASTLTIVGPEASPGVLRLNEFATRNRIPHRWLAPDDPAAAGLLAGSPAMPQAGQPSVRVVIRGQQVIDDPSNLKVAKVLGLDLAMCQTEPADLIVVGAGPAGLAAAVYGASEGLTTAVVDDVAIGGQAGTSSRIENYLGFPTGISGGELAFRAEVQAIKFGARVTVPRRATALTQEDGFYVVRLDDKTDLRGRSIVIATGARYRRLGLPRQEEFEGAGIYYAATEVEARLCRKADVVVVGSGNSAGQAAMFLAETSRSVRLLVRGPDLSHSMSQYLISRLEHAPNVRIQVNSQITCLHGDAHLDAVQIVSRDRGSETFPVRAVFVMIGSDPCTDWLRGTTALDDRNFVLTGQGTAADDGDRAPSPYLTNLPGVFAVGDVRSGSVKRVASAVGEGSVVVQAVHRYLEEVTGTCPPLPM
jgi:thioredoxin reductase (NADPH)